MGGNHCPEAARPGKLTAMGEIAETVVLNVPVWLVPLWPEAQEVQAALAALRTRPHRLRHHHHGIEESDEIE